MPPRLSVPAPSFGAGGGGAGAGPEGWGQPHAPGTRARLAFIPLATSLGRVEAGVSQGQPRGSGCGPQAGRWDVELRGVVEALGFARTKQGSTARYLEGKGLRSPGHA